MRIGLLVVGYKGLLFLQRMVDRCTIAFVVSYESFGTLDNSFRLLQDLCEERGIPFIERREFCAKVVGSFYDVNLICVVGWQYLLSDTDERFVVFHDSLLPKLRGFAPTVTALILGDKQLGVTALKPAVEADRGEVYGQEMIAISYPLKIRTAFEKLGDAYGRLAERLLQQASTGGLRGVVQDEREATYSIWRDDFDYCIAWTWPADKIARFVDAVGWPFSGAFTMYEGKEIIVDEVECIGDLRFPDRHPGKIWTVGEGSPQVVCGVGMLKINAARYRNGGRVIFKALRRRFG